MNPLAIRAIELAGVIHIAIILANIPLPGKLQVRKHLNGVPRFIQQVFYVHWIYIVLVLGLFAALCLGFAPTLAGGTALGRFLSAYLAGFWLLRIILQCFYYDKEVRRANALLDGLYVIALVTLVGIFGWTTFAPRL